MGNDIERPYAGPRMTDQQLLTLDEVRNGKVEVPEGSYPYTVQPGDNLWTIAVANGYGDPPDMNAFYTQNPQYDSRNPNEIYPGEIVLVNVPENGTVPTGEVAENGQPIFQNYKEGAADGEPYSAEVGENGAPTHSIVVNSEGVEIRTDENGRPANGRYTTNPDAKTDEVVFMAEYRDGHEVPGTRSKVGIM